MSKSLKLYIWRGILCDFKCGIGFAVAHNIDEARRVIVENFQKENGYISETLPVDLFRVEPEVREGVFGTAIWGG